MMAAVGASPQVVGLLLAYSLGLGIPFILVALAVDRAPLVTRPLLRYSRYIEVVGGGLVIFLGLALIFDWLGLIAQQFNGPCFIHHAVRLGVYCDMTCS